MATRRAALVTMRRVFFVSWLTWLLVIVVWSLATPLMAAPDEPAQVAKAAAVVRGQWVGQLVGGPSSPFGVVRIPQAYADLGRLVSCYQFKADTPASCAPAYSGGSATVRQVTYVARYQPLYYALVGLPSLLIQSAKGIYLMRLVSALLSAFWLALAVMAVAAWSRSRRQAAWALAGVVVAATPSVIFFGSVVNPTGLEASEAICLWTCVVVWSLDRLPQQTTPDLRAGLVALTTAAASAECLTRSMSPFWVALVALAGLALASRQQLRALLASPGVRWCLGITAVCAIIAVAWIVAESALNVVAPSAPVPRSVGEWRLLRMGLDRTELWWTEMVSRDGWLPAPAPRFTYWAWAALLAGLGGAALARASRRQVAVLVTLVVAVVFIPVLIATGQAHRLGITWQGKDTLALAVGVPIVAAGLVGANVGRLARTRSTGGAMASGPLVAAVTIWVIATATALFGDLRRNGVGDAGPIFGAFHAAWQPPGGALVVMLAGIATEALAAVWFLYLAGRPSMTLAADRDAVGPLPE